MQSIKQCTDHLAFMGKPMNNEDFIKKILSGLDYEQYKSVIDAMNARDSSITFEELHEKLITKEITLFSSLIPRPFLLLSMLLIIVSRLQPVLDPPSTHGSLPTHLPPLLAHLVLTSTNANGVGNKVIPLVNAQPLRPNFLPLMYLLLPLLVMRPPGTLLVFKPCKHMLSLLLILPRMRSVSTVVHLTMSLMISITCLFMLLMTVSKN